MILYGKVVVHCFVNMSLYACRVRSVFKVLPYNVHFKTANTTLFRSSSTAPEKKRIIFCGTPQIAASTLQLFYDALQSENVKCKIDCEIVGVVSQPHTITGRKAKQAKPVHSLCSKLNIPLLTPESAKDPAFLDHLASLDIDLCVTAAYGQYLPKRFLALPRFGTVNIHPSLLPKYRGAAPVQRCLESGDSETGVTVLYTVSKMDAGPVLRQLRFPLAGHEKAGEVLHKAFTLDVAALVDALPSIFDGSAVSAPQNEEEATAAPKLRPEDAMVDFSAMTAAQVHNRCRGYAEGPGVYAYFVVEVQGPEALRVKLLTTRVLSVEEGEVGREPGEVSVVRRDGKALLAITCSDGSVLGVSELQTRKAMSAQDFVHGLRGDFRIRWVKAGNKAASVE